MRLILLLSLIGFQNALADLSCQCALFLNNEQWLPQRVAFNSTSRYSVDCSKFGQATEQCKDFCIREMESMKEIIRNGVSMQDKFPPIADLPCIVDKHVSTLSFSRACGSQAYVISSIKYGPSICCDSSALVQWCSYEDSHYYQEQNIAEGRKLNLEKDKNDISNNEIDVMEKPIKEKLKVSSVVINSSSPPASWMETISSFIGYNDFLNEVKNVDIFSLPGKIQGAIKDYRDEISMGRCYMEFTTFKLFTKQENPFGDIMRHKRDVADTEEEELHNQNEQPKRLSQVQVIEGVLRRFAERYGRDGEARQQSSLVSTLVNLFTHFMNSQGDSNGGAASLLSLAGPLLSQISAKPNSASPTGSDSNGGPQEASPLPMMAMQLIGSALDSYFAPTENDTTKEKAPYPPPYSKPTKPTSGTGLASGMGSILEMLGTASGAPSSSPVRRKPTGSQTRPETSLDEQKPKSFANMILDFIRPVFISIIGNTPGESGVESIRRVSVLSTNGRVDNTLKDEVDSPFFCFKRYAVNKAWSLTEIGVNSLVAKFTPEERETMKRALS